MRIYITCKEAIKEVERDLFEMGVEVRGYSMQDKVVEGNEDYFTKEMTAYGFQVTKPMGDVEEFIKYMYPDDYERMRHWCDHEFAERTALTSMNPGEAWKIRREIWTEYLHDGKFGYTYSERMNYQINEIIEELQTNPSTRQAIIEVHNNNLDLNSLGGVKRIPCSMHYQFLIREEKVDMIYIMRSSDLLLHFCNDNYLAIMLQNYVADCLGREVGKYTFFTGSLHSYYKDLKERGIF